MNKNETYEGTWIEYFRELEKYVTEKTITDNYDHFLECWQYAIIPCRAIRLL